MEQNLQLYLFKFAVAILQISFPKINIFVIRVTFTWISKLFITPHRSINTRAMYKWWYMYIYNRNGKYLSLKLSMTENDSFVERGFYNTFLLHASEYVRACVLACMRAWAKYRKVRTISLLPSSFHLLPPLCPAFFALFFFLSQATRRKRKKLHSCCD